MYVGGLSGVTAVRVGEGERGGVSLQELCADTSFRIQNRELCGQDIERTPEGQHMEVQADPKAPPPPSPRRTIPTIIAPPDPATDPPDPPPVPYDPGPGTETETVTTVSSRGPGWSSGGGQPEIKVQLDAPAAPIEERGFGLLEVAIGAGLAWILSRAYQG